MRILCILPDNKMDYLAKAVVEGLNKTNHEIYCTSPNNSAKTIVDDNKAIQLINEVDWVFIMHHGKRPGKYYLLKYLSNWDKAIFIDGSEWQINGRPPFDKDKLVHKEFLEQCRLYFKRECYPEYIDLGIKPLPFAVVASDVGTYTGNKNIDVLCAFGQNKGLPDPSVFSWREVAIQACEELKKEGYKIVNHRVNNYLEYIGRSWITIDAWGGGEINARTFQIPINKSLGFYKRFNIIIPNFTEDTHYVGWDSGEELKNKIRHYLSNKDKVQNMIDVGYENTLKNHTDVSRIKYIFEWLIQ